MPRGIYLSEDQRSMIVQMLNSGTKPAEVVKTTGIAKTTVYRVATECGYVFRQSDRVMGDVLHALMANESVRSVARKFGVSTGWVRQIRNNNDVALYDDYSVRLEKFKKMIAEKSSSFEYVSGFENGECSVILRCRRCGEEQEVSASTVRHWSKQQCKHCRKLDKAARAAEQKAARAAELLREKEEARNRRQALKALKTARQMQIRFCACGNPMPEHSKHCKECSNRLQHKNQEIKRRAKIRNALVDSDISLQQLYERDNGVCWLCGGACDLNDYVVQGETIVCGNSYPSIDHVIPLSKGGKHAWNNVKLAHRGCNSVKRDRILTPPPIEMEMIGGAGAGGGRCLPLKPKILKNWPKGGLDRGEKGEIRGNRCENEAAGHLQARISADG